MMRRLLLLMLRGAGGVRRDGGRRHGQRRRRRERPRRRQRGLEGQAHRGDLRGEPQLRQPVRRLGGRERARATRSAAKTIQIGQMGVPVHVPAAERRNLTVPPLSSPLCDATDHFANAPFTIDDSIPPRPRDVSRSRASFAPNGLLPNGSGPARRLHPRPRAPLLPGAVPARRREAEPLRDRAATRSGSRWATTTPQQLPIYHVPARRRRHPDYAIADNFFQAAFGGSFLNHQWLIAAATPV